MVDRYDAVVADETQFAKSVHEKTDAGSGGADHLCQCFLIDIWTNWLRGSFVAEMREQKQKARETLLARIKQLVDQVLNNSAVPGQQIRHEQFRNLFLSSIHQGTWTKVERLTFGGIRHDGRLQSASSSTPENVLRCPRQRRGELS
jgi:hypothetical protein